MSDVDLIKQKRSDCDIYVYQGAGHGFSCDERGSFNEAANKQAWDRTLAWFGKNVG
jgi:carboxymethylenebutenolidase